MLTTTHAALAGATAPGRRGVALGAVLPDLPAWGLGAWHAVRGARRADLVERIYHRPGARELQLAAHSLLGPALLAATRLAPGLAAGWASHCLLDAATHHDDAWPLAWPLSRRRLRSPVSYWQVDHHARALQVAEVAALGLLARRRRAARLALAVASLPLLRASREGLAGALGVAVDPGARARDLA